MFLSPNESARIDYFFQEGKTKFLLPNQPSSVTVSQNTSHEHFYAIDGTSLSRRSDKIHWEIVISGFSGVAKRNFVDINGLKTLTSIAKILETFEEFLAKYRKEGKKVDFYDLLKQKIYKDAFPVAFTYIQSVDESRLGYKWELQLMCYSEVSQKPPKLNAYEEFFAGLTETVDRYTSEVEDLNILIDSISDSVNRPVRELLGSTSRALNSTLNIVQSTRGGIQSTRNTVIKAIDTIVDAVNTAQNFVGEVVAIFEEDLPSFYAKHTVKEGMADIKSTYENLGLAESRVALSVEEAVYRLNILAGMFGAYTSRSQSSLKLKASGGSFLDTENSLATLASFNTLDNNISTNDNREQSKYQYILRAGDNLYRVAIQVYNDVNRWYEIAELNGWLDANTTSSGYPPSAGNIIFLPSDPNELGLSAVPNLVGGGSILLTDLDLYGDDLQLNVDDLKLVSKEDNFVQLVTNRIRTVAGELVDNLEYGLNDVIGTTTSDSFMALQIIDQLLQDPRVLRVSDVILEQEADRLILDLNVVPFQGDSVNIIVPIGD